MPSRESERRARIAAPGETGAAVDPRDGGLELFGGFVKLQPTRMLFA